jgi:hypothetical protein
MTRMGGNRRGAALPKRAPDTVVDVLRRRVSLRGRTILLAAMLAALVVAAVLSAGLVRSSASATTGADGCHTRVTCAGQPATTPLGSSALPATEAVVAIVAPVVAVFAVRSVHWRDRLTAGRLFRPPRLAL